MGCISAGEVPDRLNEQKEGVKVLPERILTSLSKLGLNELPTEAELKKRYRQICLRHHPDTGGDTKRFVSLKKDYESVRKYIFLSSVAR